jgi:hypothetical protein
MTRLVLVHLGSGLLTVDLALPGCVTGLGARQVAIARDATLEHRATA